MKSGFAGEKHDIDDFDLSDEFGSPQEDSNVMIKVGKVDNDNVFQLTGLPNAKGNEMPPDNTFEISTIKSERAASDHDEE